MGHFKNEYQDRLKCLIFEEQEYEEEEEEDEEEEEKEREISFSEILKLKKNTDYNYRS